VHEIELCDYLINYCQKQDQLLNAKDSNGKRLGSIEGDGMEFDLSRKAPTFD
jgi:hypothetical protein